MLENYVRDKFYPGWGWICEWRSGQFGGKVAGDDRQEVLARAWRWWEKAEAGQLKVGVDA